MSRRNEQADKRDWKAVRSSRWWKMADSDTLRLFFFVALRVEFKLLTRLLNITMVFSSPGSSAGTCCLRLLPLCAVVLTDLTCFRFSKITTRWYLDPLRIALFTADSETCPNRMSSGVANKLAAIHTTLTELEEQMTSCYFVSDKLPGDALFQDGCPCCWPCGLLNCWHEHLCGDTGYSFTVR